MLPDTETFKHILRSSENAEAIVDKYIINGAAWLFEKRYDKKSRERFEDFRRLVANSLGLITNECALVGSAKTGFSLHPEKDFRSFTSESDLDTIIVSKALFDEIWDEYLELSYRVKNSVKPLTKKDIFRQFVSIKLKSGYQFSTPRIQDRLQAFGEIQSKVDTKFLMAYQINFRIYRSWNAVYKYHGNNITELRKRTATS